ncbi:hypothetical protein PM082_019126 [Marasmius tenuissimus]|nr:hypothetical protein PM082_019126 [Marasmius tenuissimus]
MPALPHLELLDTNSKRPVTAFRRMAHGNGSKAASVRRRRFSKRSIVPSRRQSSHSICTLQVTCRLSI